MKSLRAYDPVVSEECARRHLDCAKNLAFERIEYFRSGEHAIRGSDALFICSDSEEFRGLGSVIRQVVRPPYPVIDGRRPLAESSQLRSAGYHSLRVGDSARKTAGPTTARKDRTA